MNAERLRRAGSVAWAVVGVATLLAVLLVVVWQVRVIFPPLILAGAIVFLLNPVVSAFQHRGLPRAAGAALAYLFVVATVTLGGVGLYPLVVDQVDELRDEWPHIKSDLNDFVDDVAERSEGTFFEFTRQDIEDAFDNDGGTFEEQFAQAREIGAEVLHVVLIVVLGPILAFYLLVDLPHLRRVATELIPEAARDEVLLVGSRLNRAIGGFFRGQLLVALIVGVLCSIGLGIIQLRFWFLIGMIAGLFNIIPLVGPWVGGIPGVTIALTTGSPVKAILVVAIMVGVQQVDNHLITPYVMQRAVQLHPVVVILALLAGGNLAGFAGLLLAVPATAVLKIVVSHVWHTYVLGQPPLPEAGPGGLVEDVAARPENQGEPLTPTGASGAGPESRPAAAAPRP